MTRKGIEEAVAFWTPRLGLTHWDIQIVWDQKEWERETEGSEHSETCESMIWRPRDYDTAKLYVNPGKFKSWSRAKTHQIIVHELLHLVTREVDFILDLLETNLHRDVDTAVTLSHKHAVEGMVDRLAYRLVELAGIT